ncbi:MAG: helix-turn-helix domain-containing protein [Kineosporiaceae bacterium]|nr:helix-turn-helix domain-containing protein [Kineosporiaceae bacterium]
MNPASAAAILREARLRADLTQTELATRAGVTQSVVSAYESGRREPALRTLARLVRAAGYDLTVIISEPLEQDRPLNGPIGRIVRQRRRDLVAAASAHGASNLRVFGSVARGQERPDSDIDLLVDLPPSVGLLGLARLQADLESVLDGHRVDLVPAQDLKPGVRQRVDADAVDL